jgi:hypothetical protein
MSEQGRKVEGEKTSAPTQVGREPSFQYFRSFPARYVEERIAA